jgi:hypothetical protein
MAAANASQAQRIAEDFMKEASKDFAIAERNYRVALARKIIELHDGGTAWSVCADVARGDVEVARLRMLRDVAEGVREAAGQAAWRRTADRKDTQAFVAWSMRRDLAEDPPQPRWSDERAAIR